MNNDGIWCQQALDLCGIKDVPFKKPEPGVGQERRDVSKLDFPRIERIEGIDSGYLSPAGKQAVYYVGSNEPRTAGHQTSPHLISRTVEGRDL